MFCLLSHESRYCVVRTCNPSGMRHLSATCSNNLAGILTLPLLPPPVVGKKHTYSLISSREQKRFKPPAAGQALNLKGCTAPASSTLHLNPTCKRFAPPASRGRLRKAWLRVPSAQCDMPMSSHTLLDFTSTCISAHLPVEGEALLEQAVICAGAVMLQQHPNFSTNMIRVMNNHEQQS